MEIVDVLIVVDAPRIIRDFHTNDCANTGVYQSLGEAHGYIYMIATWYHAQDEADSELDVFAKQGDKIRWRMTSLSMGGNYQGMITEFVINNGAQNITHPVLRKETIITPRYDENLAEVILTPVEDVFWESTVLYTGKVTYHTKFQLYVGGGGGGGGCSGGGGGTNPCGGYHWDPFIN